MLTLIRRLFKRHKPTALELTYPSVHRYLVPLAEVRPVQLSKADEGRRNFAQDLLEVWNLKHVIKVAECSPKDATEYDQGRITLARHILWLMRSDCA